MKINNCELDVKKSRFRKYFSAKFLLDNVPEVNKLLSRNYSAEKQEKRTFLLRYINMVQRFSVKELKDVTFASSTCDVGEKLFSLLKASPPFLRSNIPIKRFEQGRDWGKAGLVLHEVDGGR